ncbi:MAG: alpha-amylase family glycosyl hydrolase [Pirellula sp.]
MTLGLLPSTGSANDDEGNASPTFTSEERLQGYAQRGNTSWFLFVPELYSAPQPKRVVLTGPFRGWSQDMEESRWQLQHDVEKGCWTLAIPNANYEVIPPSTPFKFRVDDGQWMQPPESATNRESGNLVFAAGIAPVRLRAEIRTSNTLWMKLSGDDAIRSLLREDYRVTRSDGRVIAIDQILPITSSESLVCLAEEIDPRRVYYLECMPLRRTAFCRRDGWYRTLYSAAQLGAEVAPNGVSTTFRIFAPRAERVGLYLYRDANDSPGKAFKTIDMRLIGHGVWESIVSGDLHGVYYDFTVHGPSDVGDRFYETHPVHISDPYARVSVDSFGKSRVWRATKPAPPLQRGRPRMEDVIAYEVHVQDFTSELPIAESLRGTFAGMSVTGLKNARGEPIGFDHLKRLGVNVVHLMPVQEYLHYPDDEWSAAFANDPFMQEHGIASENYDWGYRTTHAFAMESRYRIGGTDHGEERDQFRDMVARFHEAGMAVIVDIVPNHTGENMDGRENLFHFGAIDTDYYYRTDESLRHIGPYGNEVKFEQRPMVQRWLIDQCRSLIDEFGIDGFRIDLAGQIDKQTLIKLKAELGDDVIVYGEPWIAPSDPEVAQSPEWGWYKKDSPITFFQDDARNAFKGPVSNPVDKRTSRGFAGGDSGMREAAMRGLLNDYPDEAHPNMGINYLDIHDNWTLADQFAQRDWDGRFGVDEGPYRMAAGLLFTSLGPIVLHGGTEFMRSKGSAGLAEITKRTAKGPLAFHGKSDTYNMRIPNLFVWDDVGRPPEPARGNCDTRAMHAYWQGWIALRRSSLGKLFRLGEKPAEGYYRWLLPEDAHLLGYIVAEKILVLINTGEAEGTFQDIVLPPGDWKLICDGVRIDHERGVDGQDSMLGAERSALDLRVPPQTIKVWVREESR